MDGRFTHATILPPGQKIDPQDYLALLSDPGCGSIVTFSAVVREIEPGKKKRNRTKDDEDLSFLG